MALKRGEIGNNGGIWHSGGWAAWWDKDSCLRGNETRLYNAENCTLLAKRTPNSKRKSEHRRQIGKLITVRPVLPHGEALYG